MPLKETIQAVVHFQNQELQVQKKGITRELLSELDFKAPHALIISGIRRCGKSTLLKQLMQRQEEKPYYINFEDPRLFNFTLQDFEKLEEVFKEQFPQNKNYFFDEIQNVADWERYVRHLLDTGKKVALTGSNASLLSRELGTKLTGRHLTYELFPFSYTEMLTFTKQKPNADSLAQYMEKGGFPEFLEQGKTAMLQELCTDILARDIIVRQGLRDERTIKSLLIYLITNVGKEFSYNKIAKILEVGSANTIISYVSFLEDSYLLFTMNKFNYSYKKQLLGPKKVYAIDTGLARANSVSFFSEQGRVLENVIFLHLRRKYKTIYFFRERHECDFIVVEAGKPVEAIQVCYQLTEENRQREIAGLEEAMDTLKIKKASIITFNQEDTLDEIKVIPAWKWMSY